MGAQRATAKNQAAELPDGFGVAVVREDGKWRCSSLGRSSLGNLSAAETELRELRSVGAVFGLLDVDDEFFVIARPAPAGTRLFLSDATAALDADLNLDDLDGEDPFEQGDLGVLSDVGLSEGVLSIILDDDEYADEQLTRIAQEMGFGDELTAVLDKLDR